MKTFQIIPLVLAAMLTAQVTAQNIPATAVADALDDLKHATLDKIDSEVEINARAFADAKNIQSSLFWADLFRPFLDIALEVFEALTAIPAKNPNTVRTWLGTTVQGAGVGKKAISILGSFDRLKQDGAALALDIDGPAYSSLVSAMLDRADATSFIVFDYPFYKQSVMNDLYGAITANSPIRISHKSTSVDRSGGDIFPTVLAARSYIANQFSTVSAQMRLTQLPPDRVAAMVSFIQARRQDVLQSRVGARHVTYQTYLTKNSTPVQRQVSYSLGTITQLEQWRGKVLDLFVLSAGFDSIGITGRLLEKAGDFVLNTGLDAYTETVNLNLSVEAVIAGQASANEVLKDATSLGVSVAKPDIGTLADAAQSYVSSSREQINMIPQQMMDALPGEVSKLLLLVDDTINYSQVTAAAPPAPTISSVTPTTLLTSNAPQLITIYGSNFKTTGDPNVSSLIFFDPAGNPYLRTPSYATTTELRYNVTVQSAVGTWRVVVTNAGQAASAPASFTVVAPPPPSSGSLTVTLEPAGARTAGAQWAVDGGAYRNSGDTATGLTPGTHTVSCKAVAGYTTPANRSVTITGGAVTSDTETYTVVTPSTYTLTLNYNPAQGGALPSPLVPQTSSTYGSYSFGYTANSVTLVQASASTGYYFTGWSGDASGAANPITVTMNGNKNITANFAPGDPNLGTLTVTIQPPEAAAAGVTWGFNESDFRASGSSVTTYPGSFLMYVHMVSGWSGAGVFPVTIIAGQTTNYVVAVSSTTGSTVGTDPRTYYTLAGLAGNTGSTDGTNSAARFNHPWHIAIDTAGNVYVADYGNHTIRKITPAGVASTLAGLAGSPGSAEGTGSTARFNMPIGIAVDTNGNVYVGEYGNSTIRKITPGGVVSTLAGLAGNTGSADGTGSAARFKNPNGVAVDNSGNVYVADYGNYTIRKITPGGAVSTLAGLAGTRGTADGVGTAARFFYPGGIAVDNAGSLYAADTFNHAIRRISSDGTVTTLAGFPGSGGAADGTGNVARFSYPAEVAVDSIGNVYVADNDNSTIRKITPAGVVSTLAGLSGHIGNTDGNDSTVRFQFATGVAIDSASNLFVADNGNSTIRTTRQVGKADQLIAFAPLPDKSAGDPPFVLIGTASSGLPVYFDIVSGPAVLDTNVVTLLGGGVVTVRAWQPGNSNYNAAAPVPRSFNVAKIPQSISFGPLSRQTLGDAPFPLSASASSGLPVSFAIVSGPAVLSGNIVTLTGAGTVVVRASQLGNSVYAPATNVDQAFSVVRGVNMITDFNRATNGQFHLVFAGEFSRSYIVEFSTNLLNWTPLTTNTVDSLGNLEFTDTSATNRTRFYRAHGL